MFGEGQALISREVAKRNRMILENRKLYAGEQSEVYLEAFLKRLQLAGVNHYNGDKLLGYDSDTIRGLYKNVLQGVNLTAPVCNLYADLLFSEGIRLKTDDDEWAREFVEREELNSKLHLGQIIAGYTGDVIYKVWQDEKAKISVIPTENWMPIKNEFGEVEGHAIIHTIEPNEKLKTTLNIDELARVVIYKPGINIYKAFLIKDGKIFKQVPWKEEVFGKLPGNAKETDSYDYIEETGYKYNMIQRISNISVDYSDFGKPFITQSFKENERELCVRATQRARILDKNADPGMYGPSQVIGVDPITNKPIVATQGKYIAIDKDDVKPGYITWDGNLEECRQAEDRALQYIYQETGTNAAALSSTIEGIGALSGTALERVLMRPLSVVKMLKSKWDKTIKKMIKLAYEIEKGKELSVAIEWQDGLPKSAKEDLEIILMKNGGQPVLDEIRAIAQANDISEEEAKIIYEDIKQQTLEKETPILAGIPDFAAE